MNIVDPRNNASLANDSPSTIADVDFSCKSELMDWLRSNRIGLEQAFSGLTRRSWTAVAAQATAAGIRNGHGRPVTGGGCRQAWHRLTKSAAARTKSKDLARNHGDEARPPRRSAQGPQVFDAYDASKSTSTDVWSSFAEDDFSDPNNQSSERNIKPERKRNSDGV